MAKMRIHELAKEIGGSTDSNLTAEIVKYLQDNGSDVKNHMSSVEDDDIARVRKHFAPKPAVEAKPAEEAKAPEHVQTADDGNAQKKRPVQPLGYKVGQTGTLNGRDGKVIKYKVGADGRLINLADGSQMPFKMTKMGVARLDGTLLRKPQPGAQAPAQATKPAQQLAERRTENRPTKPMTQVFDGRSERDKRNAASSTVVNNKSSKGGLTNALGDKMLDLKSQLKPVPPQPVEAPKPKKVEVEPAKEEPAVSTVSAPVATPKVEPVKTEEPKAVDVVAKTETAVSTQPEKVEVAAKPAEVKTENKAENKPESKPAERPQYNNDRNNGERRQYGDRPQYNNDRNNGERRQNGDRPQYNNDRNNGERRPYGDRPQYNNDRNNGERRPYGDRPQYNNDRNNGERRPYGDRPQYSNDRNNGERRPYGDRPQGERRPYGDRPQGDRPFGDRPQGDRPSFNRDGGRPQFGNRGPAAGGFPNKDKDDDNNGRKNFSRRNDTRPSGGSIKSELANDLGKNQRAESLKDRKRDKNDRRDRDFDEDGMKNGKAKKDPNRKGAFQKPVVKPVQQEEDEIKTISVPEVITIKELADKMKQNAAAIIKKLFMAGKMVNLNSEITFEEAEEIALEYEIICEKEVAVNVVEELLKDIEEDEEKLEKRAPVVCVMGHVDHGKTSLLDAIRATNVTAREAGGITQHIGAYMVEIDGQKITFLDTPGHEAFTSMRMRGAQSTDIAILVVAADDGVMPQTVEAINHAKAAEVQIIVAVNKIDKPGANIERVKQELTEHGLVAEDWGGDTVFVPVSAKTHEGIENLLEMVLLTADVLELKANPKRNARGIVIEAQLDKGRGPVATVLVQKGTLNVGDNIAIGAAHGKVRAMIDDKGRKVKTAGPSTPVEILGLNAVPEAGEVMMAVADEKEARTIAEAFIAQSKEKLLAETKARLNLEGLFSQIQAGEVKELNLIIKADVMGSVEAVKQSLVKLSNEEVVVRVIHGGVGNINESDVNLAMASNAIIIGFNVKPDNQAKETADHQGVDVKLYRVIYDAINDIEAAMKGMLKPIFEEKVIGHAEVRQLFKASGLGIIAGSFVLDGKIERGCSARISREGKQIYEGPLASLKRFKDDVKEVAAGYECGLVFEKFNDLAELDQVEFYKMVEVPRS